MTNQPERIIVKEISVLCHAGVFNGKFSAIKETLDKFEKEGWEGIEFTYDRYIECDVFDLYKHRPETNEEQDERLAAIKEKEKESAAAKEKRRAQYETLREEFGD